MNIRTIWLLATFALALGSMLFGFWPLMIVGIALAVAARHYVVAGAYGFFADILYGVPVGSLHYIFFPFTIGTFLVILLFEMGGRHLFEGDTHRL